MYAIKDQTSLRVLRDIHGTASAALNNHVREYGVRPKDTVVSQERITLCMDVANAHRQLYNFERQVYGVK